MSTNNSQAAPKVKPQLFEFAIFLLPTEEQAKLGKKPEIIVQPKTIIASDDKSAFVQAIRSIPKEYADVEMDQVEVAVRAF